MLSKKERAFSGCFIYIRLIFKDRMLPLEDRLIHHNILWNSIGKILLRL